MITIFNNRSLRDAIFLLLLMIYILAGTSIVPLHGDESTQIYMGRDFYYQFVQQDLSRVLYSEAPETISESAAAEQHLRLLNGTLPKYLFGLAAYVGGYNFADINDQWDWCCDLEYNRNNGHIPSDDLLLRARWMSSVLLAAGGVVIFLIGRAAGGRPVAYLVSLYYALNPVLLLNGRRAMMEGGLIFFSLLVVLAGIVFIRTEKTGWKTVLSVIFLSTASGLAVASKHTAAFGVAVIFVGCWAAALLNAEAQRRRENKSQTTKVRHISPLLKNTLLLLFTGIAAFGIFYALNPAWWGSPLARIGTVLHLRTELLDGQMQFFGGYANFVEQSAGFFRQVFIALPQYYEVANWQDFIGEQITYYEASPWRGISIGGTLLGGMVFLVLATAGMGFLWRDKAVSFGVRVLVILYGVVIPILMLLLTPLEWQRYYVPVYPAVGLLASVGLVGFIKTGYQAWQKQRLM